MFNKKLKQENKQLKRRIKRLEKALIAEGHVHDYKIISSDLMNGFEVSNGMSKEYLVKYKCKSCGDRQTRMCLYEPDAQPRPGGY